MGCGGGINLRGGRGSLTGNRGKTWDAEKLGTVDGEGGQRKVLGEKKIGWITKKKKGVLWEFKNGGELGEKKKTQTTK